MDSDTLYVGIDPSLTCTAMVCLPGCDVRTWRFKHGDVVSRCRAYADAAQKTLENALDCLRCTKPSAICREGRCATVCIEKPHFNMQGNSAWLLPLYAFIMENVSANWPRVYPVAPATLKKFATGSGRAEKSMMGQAVQRHWGDELPEGLLGNDAIDAFALAKMAQCIADPASDWTAYQRECAEKLERYQVEEVA